jgi:hypothetical protein
LSAGLVPALRLCALRGHKAQRSFSVSILIIAAALDASGLLEFSPLGDVRAGSKSAEAKRSPEARLKYGTDSRSVKALVAFAPKAEARFRVKHHILAK